MHDAAAVRVSERLEHLRSDLDGVSVGQTVGTEHLAQRATLNVLVGDVDMTLVLAVVVGADAAWVAEP